MRRPMNNSCREAATAVQCIHSRSDAEDDDRDAMRRCVVINSPALPGGASRTKIYTVWREVRSIDKRKSLDAGGRYVVA